MIFGRHANLKCKYGNRHFWCREYYVDRIKNYMNILIRSWVRQQKIADKKESVRTQWVNNVAAGGLIR